MDLEIDTINVTVTGEDWDEDKITREFQWYLRKALAELSKDEMLLGMESDEVDFLELPPIDWDAEVDKTGKLIQLLKSALEDNR